MEINDKGGLDWFQKVQNMAYKDAHKELITLTGIGPKVSQSQNVKFYCIFLKNRD